MFAQAQFLWQLDVDPALWNSIEIRFTDVKDVEFERLATPLALLGPATGAGSPCLKWRRGGVERLIYLAALIDLLRDIAASALG